MSTTITVGINADTRRVVPLSAVHNFRDLGGFSTTNGRVTRWHRLFRSDALHRATEGDLALLRPLGLHTVIDLRSQPEIDQHGTFNVEEYPVNFVHQPIVDETWDINDIRPDDDARTYLSRTYLHMLDVGAPRFAAAIRTLARPGALPAVFHCAAGKDRTGLVAALVLAALNVPDQIIAADYALTAPAMERFKRWAVVNEPAIIDRMGTVPPQFMEVPAGAILDVLDHIRGAYGNVATYLVSIGVAAADIAALSQALTAPIDTAPDLAA